MKYNVGDEVRVSEDLEVGKNYKAGVAKEMKQFRGKNVTIDEVCEAFTTCDVYKIKEDNGEWVWSADMLEPAKTNWDKLKEISTGEFASTGFCNIINIMRKKTSCLGVSCKECKEWLSQPYEEEKEILDEAEKKYLENVIKPFRNKVKSISKEADQKGEFIRIKIINDTAICFPYFKKKTMYKGMNPHTPYTLEELGL